MYIYYINIIYILDTASEKKRNICTFKYSVCVFLTIYFSNTLKVGICLNTHIQTYTHIYKHTHNISLYITSICTY